MRSPIEPGMWWRSLGDTFDKICREFIRKAQAAEYEKHGHECGHQFTIQVGSTLHLSGPDEHTDADWSDGLRPVTVRAHNLRDALLVAASLPLSDWLEQEDEE